MENIRQYIVQAWRDGFMQEAESPETWDEKDILEVFAESDTGKVIQNVPDLLNFNGTWVWIIRTPLKKPGEFTYFPFDRHHLILVVPYDYELTEEREKRIADSVAQMVITMSGGTVVQEVSPGDPNFN